MPGKRKRRARPGRENPETVFLDANIFMYAAGGPHPLREPCRRALRHAVDRHLNLVTNSEVLQEILYRYFAIAKPRIAEKVYGTATSLRDRILPVEERHTARVLELRLDSPGLSPRDAIHAATMELAGLHHILTTDGDFDAIASVTRIDPGELAP